MGLIDEKNQRSKISCYCLFKHFVPEISHLVTWSPTLPFTVYLLTSLSMFSMVTAAWYTALLRILSRA
jgi:hypothetical protein